MTPILVIKIEPSISYVPSNATLKRLLPQHSGDSDFLGYNFIEIGRQYLQYVKEEDVSKWHLAVHMNDSHTLSSKVIQNQCSGHQLCLTHELKIHV